MDCQKLIVYGILILVGLYLLKDVCGVKIPLIDEGFENEEMPKEETVVTQGLLDFLVPHLEMLNILRPENY